jgi:hypothetical protein
MALEKLRITIADGTDDGRDVDVVPNIGDTLRFETALRKNKAWGALADNGIRLQTYRAWSAAERQGLIDLDWPTFSGPSSPVVSVLVVQDEPEQDDADEDGEEVDGVGKDTPEARRTSSSSPSRSARTNSLPTGDEKTP